MATEGAVRRHHPDTRDADVKRSVTSAEAIAEMLRSDIMPRVEYPGAANRPWPSTCLRCGAFTAPRLKQIRRGECGCRACGVVRFAAARRIPDVEAFRELADAGAWPEHPYPGFGEPWLMTCLRCGRQDRTSLALIRKGHSPCGHCSGRIIDPAVAAGLMVERGGVEPLDPFPGCMANWRCRCLTCGREVSPRYNTIQQGIARGCGYCGKVRVDAKDAESDMRAAGLEPLEPYVGTNTPWRCRCETCGREASPRHHGVKSGQGGCRYCGRNKIDPAEAVAAVRAEGYAPQEPYPATGKRKWLCRHDECGRVIEVRYHDLIKGHGCPFCAERGFDPGADGFVYVVADHDDLVRKVGVTGVPERRLAEHACQGLPNVLFFRGPMPGTEALRIERSWLAEVRAAGAKPVQGRDWPAAGRTESWATADYPKLPDPRFSRA